MAMTWPHAAAALVVEMDRAINAEATAPVRVAAASRVGSEYWRLGWRPSAEEPVPLAWDSLSQHTAGMLVEEGVVEAYVMYLGMAGLQTRAAAGDGTQDALARAYSGAAVGRSGGTEMLWRAFFFPAL